MILCFATNNNNKIREVTSLVSKEYTILSLEDIGCADEIPENHLTIEENSYAKADYIFRNFKINCFADDTGLEVEALGGEPGVHSARYAGAGKNSEDNIALLIKKMGTRSVRSASFKTVITLIINGNSIQFSGVIKGTIAKESIGSNGFGYDPVFIPDGSDLTFAEMPLDQKNLISHRAIATRKLIGYLNSLIKISPYGNDNY